VRYESGSRKPLRERNLFIFTGKETSWYSCPACLQNLFLGAFAVCARFSTAGKWIGLKRIYVVSLLIGGLMMIVHYNVNNFWISVAAGFACCLFF
jgi:hypothetical protein